MKRKWSSWTGFKSLSSKVTLIFWV
jgi:hypothetical protein